MTTRRQLAARFGSSYALRPWQVSQDFRRDLDYFLGPEPPRRRNQRRAVNMAAARRRRRQPQELARAYAELRAQLVDPWRGVREALTPGLRQLRSIFRILGERFAHVQVPVPPHVHVVHGSLATSEGTHRGLASFDFSPPRGSENGG